jgi:hypothetical protein
VRSNVFRDALIDFDGDSSDDYPAVPFQHSLMDACEQRAILFGRGGETTDLPMFTM